MAFTVFFGGFLLFSVELLVAKAALARLGGSPTVWTTSLLFFQTLLLLGYAYAHSLVTRAPLAVQRRLHLLVVALALASLGAQSVFWGQPLITAGGVPDVRAVQVLRLLMASVGMPFFALAATTSLLQSWFTRARGTSPWHFAALSNAGAFAALLVYPLIIEPRVGLRAQSWAWAGAFGLWAVVLAATAVTLTAVGQRTPGAPAAPAEAVEGPGDRQGAPSGLQRLRWVVLSGLGTLLLATTTSVMCQELVPAPALWALPLALYLLSFIIAFAGGPRFNRPRLFVVLWLLGLLGALVNVLMMPDASLLQLVAFSSLFLLASNLLCHGELFAARPATQYLSSFYLWISFGGALGTLASTVASLAFDDYWEFPLSVMALSVGTAFTLTRNAPPEARRERLVAAGATIVLALSLGAARLSVFPLQRHAVRNFFGVLRVQEGRPPGDAFPAYALRHGDITYGLQFTAPGKLDAPTAYYTWSSGLGVGLRALASRKPLDVAVLGLGIGTVAALLERGDRVDFYEIDPNVIALARGAGGYFHYLERAKPTVEVKLGDARRLLQDELEAGARKKDLLVVDVFSGDSVPAHLLTLEAMDLYWGHLKDDGLLALHVSNRHLSLDEVVFGITRERGLSAVLIQSPELDLATASTWVLVAKKPELLTHLELDVSQVLVRALPRTVVWTDDFQSVLSVIRVQ